MDNRRGSVRSARCFTCTCGSGFLYEPSLPTTQANTGELGPSRVRMGGNRLRADTRIVTLEDLAVALAILAFVVLTCDSWQLIFDFDFDLI